ncbi:hypothetical protein Emag_003296 [Eimeria magna]
MQQQEQQLLQQQGLGKSDCCCSPESPGCRGAASHHGSSCSSSNNSFVAGSAAAAAAAHRLEVYVRLRDDQQGRTAVVTLQKLLLLLPLGCSCLCCFCCFCCSCCCWLIATASAAAAAVAAAAVDAAAPAAAMLFAWACLPSVGETAAAALAAARAAPLKDKILQLHAGTAAARGGLMQQQQQQQQGYLLRCSSQQQQQQQQQRRGTDAAASLQLPNSSSSSSSINSSSSSSSSSSRTAGGVLSSSSSSTNSHTKMNGAAVSSRRGLGRLLPAPWRSRCCLSPPSSSSSSSSSCGSSTAGGLTNCVQSVLGAASIAAREPARVCFPAAAIGAYQLQQTLAGLESCSSSVSICRSVLLVIQLVCALLGVCRPRCCTSLLPLLQQERGYRAAAAAAESCVGSPCCSSNSSSSRRPVLYSFSAVICCSSFSRNVYEKQQQESPSLCSSSSSITVVSSLCSSSKSLSSSSSSSSSSSTSLVFLAAAAGARVSLVQQRSSSAAAAGKARVSFLSSIEQTLPLRVASLQRGFYYRFHKPIGKGRFSRYQEFFQKPRSLESTQRLLFNYEAPFAAAKASGLRALRLRKRLAAATNPQQLLHVLEAYRHMRPRRCFMLLLALDRLVALGGCDPTDFRFRVLCRNILKAAKRFQSLLLLWLLLVLLLLLLLLVLLPLLLLLALLLLLLALLVVLLLLLGNKAFGRAQEESYLPRVCWLLSQLRATAAVDALSRHLKPQIPLLYPQQLAVAAAAFGAVRLQHKCLLESIAAAAMPYLSEMHAGDLLKLLQGFAGAQLHHYGLVSAISSEVQRRVHVAAAAAAGAAGEGSGQWGSSEDEWLDDASWQGTAARKQHQQQQGQRLGTVPSLEQLVGFPLLRLLLLLLLRLVPLPQQQL